MSVADPITLKRLVVAKQLYRQALNYSIPPFVTARKILAVICFDISTETSLKSAISFLDSSKQPADSFQAVVQQCESLMQKSGVGTLQDKSNIEHVHDLRNDAQHKAKFPTDAEVNDCRTYTNDFQNKLLNTLWGLSLEKISLTDNIQNVEVKKLLSDAELNLSSGNYNGAAENASEGLSMALNFVKQSLVGHSSMFSDEIMTLSFNKPKANKKLSEAIRRMQDTLTYISLGINYSEYLRFRSIAGYTIFTYGGNSSTGMKQPLQSFEAEYAVHYSIDTVIQIENQVGDLKKPFGREYWE